MDFFGCQFGSGIMTNAGPIVGLAIRKFTTGNGPPSGRKISFGKKGMEFFIGGKNVRFDY